MIKTMKNKPIKYEKTTIYGTNALIISCYVARKV
jgi:hypothetical protein